MELPEDEVPAEDIWHHPQRLEEWFEAIKQRRESSTGTTEPVEDVEMDTNAFARELIGD